MGLPNNTHLRDKVNLLRELYKKSTNVVNWYPHLKEVRGPFGRWFNINEVDPKYEKNVASTQADAAYCAAAMNEVPFLINTIELLLNRVEELEMNLAVENTLIGVSDD